MIKGKKNQKLKAKKMKFMRLNRKGFGLNEVIGIAAGLLIASLVIIPGLIGLAEGIIDQLSDWWDDLAETIFQYE